jgi:excisionase family DNA binding protein
MAPTPLAHSPADAARRISVGRTTLYGLIKAGELRATKINRRTVISEAELQRFLAERTAGDAVPA